MSYDSNTPLLGQGQASASDIDHWFAANGTCPPGLGSAILAACVTEHVNSDLVAAQVAHETGYWTSAIARDKLNPAGLGAENDDPYGKAISFPTVFAGIQAQVDHLLTYVKGDGYWTQFDPRYQAVKAAGWLGTVRVLRDLEQKWAYSKPADYAATPPEERYGAMVAAAANHLLATLGGTPPMQAQIPGFLWHPADNNHFAHGRTSKITGGAQHFSEGTDSTAWLSTTSSPPVSTHFLVKRGATLAERGKQIVRIEDTAWATNASNPFVVAMEYEHTVDQDIPDSDYEVLSQTWVDIATYVKAQGLGEIPLNRLRIKGHNEWTPDGRLCPDGVNVDRIVARAVVLASNSPVDPLTMPDLDPVPRDGFTVPFLFGAFWDTRGGLEIFGHFVSGVLEEQQHLVQYTERARFEYHPDIAGGVQLGLLGLEVLAGRHPHLI